MATLVEGGERFARRKGSRWRKVPCECGAALLLGCSTGGARTEAKRRGSDGQRCRGGRWSVGGRGSLRCGGDSLVPLASRSGDVRRSGVVPTAEAVEGLREGLCAVDKDAGVVDKTGALR